MRTHPTERQLQVTVCQWLKLALPDDAVFYSVPNESGGRDAAIRQYRMKQIGMLPGVPDLCILWNGKAIYIEMKSKKGRMEASQIATHPRFAAAGFPVTVCRSLEDVAECLTASGIPLKVKLC